MKDLTHYFSSPKKASSQSESNKSPNDNDVLTDQSLNVNNSNTPAGKKRSKAKKRKRKPTDPDVKKVAELLSNKLNFISPNTTPTEAQTVSPVAQGTPRKILQVRTCTNDSISDQSVSPRVPEDRESIHLETDEVLKTPGTPTVNAFQFLMDSRNNVIGNNSSGKTKVESDCSVSSDKPKLKARRRLLEDWADRKGAVKRKRDDEEVACCISGKLEKRAKRLKKLLRIDKPKVQGKQMTDVSKNNGNIICRADSESSSDMPLRKVQHAINSESIVSAAKATDTRSPNALPSNSSSPFKKSKDNGQNNLLNFIEVVNRENSNDEIKVYEDTPVNEVKDVIKIKMFSPLPKKIRGSVSASGSSPEEIKRKKHIKKTHKRKQNSPSKNFKNPDKSVKSVSSPDDISTCDTISSKTTRIKCRKSKTYKSNIDAKVKTRCSKSLKTNQSVIKLNKVEKSQNSDFNTGNLEATSTSRLEKVENATSERRSLRRRQNLNYEEIEINLHPSVKSIKSSSSKKLKKTKTDKSTEYIEISSDTECEERNTKKKATKLAPVFLKSTPKLKADAEVIQARKQFLLSGIPDSLKKTVEKHERIEIKDCKIFPLISHIQQKCESKLWNLPSGDLDVPELPNAQLSIDVQTLKCENLIIKKLPYEIQLTTYVDKVQQLRSVLQKIKVENPDYPVFKVFRQLYEKSGKCYKVDKKSPRRHPKKSRRQSQGVTTCEEDAAKKHELWISKYKPLSSDEILGNYQGVTELRKWLEMWKHYSQEINDKKQRDRFNSESEFESTDCDSRGSTWLPGNTIILHGPCGSGKTSAVYAVANELKFNVLELNASTKRTGKILLQELQEATRSHQVRKRESSTMSSFIEPTRKQAKKKSHKNENCQIDDRNNKNMCILLLEDIDLLFDQDEGFLSSLSQLILTSKRPIILTTTDKSPNHVQKFMNQYECISFKPLSQQCLAIWMQIMCLIEGLLADKDHLGSLLEYNKGDIRKTLLEMQFWAQSGGQLERHKVFSIETGNTCKSVLEIHDEEYAMGQVDDVSEDETNFQEQFIHRHCLASFEIFRVNKEYLIPQNMDLGNIWWNIPNILNLPNCNQSRLQRHVVQIESADPDSKDKMKINCLSNLYDHLSLSDSLFTKVNCHSSKEPVVKGVSIEVLNSLELTERKEDDNEMFVDVIQDLCHTLVNESIEIYQRIDMTQFTLNMGMPDSNERRWRANIHLCEDFLKEPIPLSNILDRRATALDYLPSLRHITRSEEKRASINTKRGNRFRHYLKELNIHFKASTSQLACDCLNIEQLSRLS